MKFKSDEQRKAVMAKLTERNYPLRRVMAPVKANPKGKKRVPMTQPPED